MKIIYVPNVFFISSITISRITIKKTSVDDKRKKKENFAF
jgi:hypothetical protein